MARRFQESSLHTGQIAYLHAKGLVELDFPVLVRPMDDRYSYVVAHWPIEDELRLYYRVWNPTTAMHITARGVFGEAYTGRQDPIHDDQKIWDAVRRIYRLASFANPQARDKGREVIRRVSEAISEKQGYHIPPISLAVVAEIYRAWQALVFPHHMTASFAAATLLLLFGVPRERVAVFGMYYQDPTVYYRNNTDWRAGFLSGTPDYTVTGIMVGGQWVPVDFSLLADGPHHRLAPTPHSHLRSSELGHHPQDGAPFVIDYAHPYTMIFSPPAPGDNSDLPLLSRIPLLQVYGVSNF